MAQEVSRRLPTTAARVRAQVRSCGICGGLRGTGAGFLRALRFSLPVLTAPTASHSSSTIRGWYNRPVSGRRTKWTVSPYPKKLKKKVPSRCHKNRRSYIGPPRWRGTAAKANDSPVLSSERAPHIN
jgi:hypothetical protein